LRIGVILPHLKLFGGVRRYIELGNSLVERGHTYTIFTPDGEKCEWMNYSGLVKKITEMEDEVPDVLITGSPEYFGLLLKSGSSLKVFYLQLEGIKNERLIVKNKDIHVMVNSTGLARRIRRRYRVEPLDGIGGVNTDMFHPITDQSDERFSAVLGLKEEFPIRIICYGRLSRPRKGTRFVIQAARKLKRAGLFVELHLFDSIEKGSDDPRLGFSPGVPYRFYLNLDQTRMPDMYGAADIFVSAEHRAGWSNTTAEAAACGIPVVCTSSGTEDFAINGLSALVVPFRNSYLIARAVRKLAMDPGLRRRLSIEAAKRMEEFTWNRVAEKIEKQFMELLGKRGLV